ADDPREQRIEILRRGVPDPSRAGAGETAADGPVPGGDRKRNGAGVWRADREAIAAARLKPSRSMRPRTPAAGARNFSRASSVRLLHPSALRGQRHLYGLRRERRNSSENSKFSSSTDRSVGLPERRPDFALDNP